MVFAHLVSYIIKDNQAVREKKKKLENFAHSYLTNSYRDFFQIYGMATLVWRATPL